MLRAGVRGLIAGAVGTLAMDLVWYIRYKRSDGSSDFLTWETASGLDSWDDASAPAKVGKLLYEASTQRELPASQARLTTNVMHWMYGVQWGVLFGFVAPSGVRLWQGPLLGGLVWLASYVSLPVAGVYQPIWSYDLKTLWQDLSAHLVYGSVTGIAMRTLPH